MRFFILIINLFIISFNCSAFETETHALITRQAYANSTLANAGSSSVINRLGLDRLDIATPFNIYWASETPPHYSTGGGSRNVGDGEAAPEGFERCQMQEFLPFPRDDFRFQLFSNTVNTGHDDLGLLPIQNWLVRGAIREDDLGLLSNALAHCAGWLAAASTGNLTRVFNHFYDPLTDRGMPGCPVGVTCQKSVDWALGYTDSSATPPREDTARRNHYSYIDARNQLWWALTRQYYRTSDRPYTMEMRRADAADRLFMWATLFRSLGNIVHLLQDTGQPQHTRSDLHSMAQTPEQQAFEGYTNARVLGSNSDNVNNAYVKSFFGERTPLSAPPLGAYPSVQFSTPLRYFTTGRDAVSFENRLGLADYSNRGFFTGGTKPGMTRNPLPPQTLEPTQGYGFVVAPCEGLLNADARLRAVPCMHYTHAVGDALNPTYAATQDQLPGSYTLPNAPVLSESIVKRIVDIAGTIRPELETVIGIAELNTTGNLTIPRAVGYSAGLLNYFFRGQITIDPPPGGLYAILDHAHWHTIDTDGYPRKPDGTVFGFTEVQIKFRNSTPDIVESGTATRVRQRMTNGHLVAVARYHRNTCYRPDLSGEIAADFDTREIIQPAGCDLTTHRTPYQEIAVSTALDVDTSGNVTVGGQTLDVNATSAQLAQFDFSADPIPINATDLLLQVVYRGNMGEGTLTEPDAIAVGMVDVSEPSYGFAFNEDYFLYHNTWLTADAARPLVPAGYDVDPSPLVNMQFCIGDRVVMDKGMGSSPVYRLQPTTFARYAAIVDTTLPHSRTGMAQFLVDGVPGTRLGVRDEDALFPRTAQAALEHDPVGQAGAYAPDPQLYGRGVVFGSWGNAFAKWYMPETGSRFYPAVPLPPGSYGILPVLADHVYLNNPQPGTCNTL